MNEVEKMVAAMHAILDHFHVHPEDPIRDKVNAVTAPDTETEVKPDA